jgi:hypothetical protein
MILVERDHFVHRFFWSIATSLGLLDLLRVSALLNDEIENVKHIGNYVALSRAVKGKGNVRVDSRWPIDS